jgi:glycosyltransferase involved in cell wall biosynthesis
VLSLFATAFGRRFGDLPEVLRFLRAHPVHDEWSVDVRSELLYLNQVTTAMAHSRFTAAQLRERWPGRAVTIPQSVRPLSRDDGERMRQRLGVEPGHLLVGTFGFMGSYKRLDKVFAAWRAWDGKPPSARLLVVGQPQDGPPVPAWPDVIYQGYVSDDDFRACLAAADFAVQLRHPTLGETSIVITSQIANGRLVVVSDTPHTAELPDEQVRRVKPDDDEIENLAEAFSSLTSRVLAATPVQRRLTRYDQRYSARHCADLIANVIRSGQHSEDTSPARSASDRIRKQSAGSSG